MIIVSGGIICMCVCVCVLLITHEINEFSHKLNFKVYKKYL